MPDNPETTSETPDPPVIPNTPPPIFNWMTAYAAQRPVSPVAVKPSKENPVMDEMKGGWRFEGKEKPETPQICTMCQWERRNEQQEEPDKEGWCEDCALGQTLGHEPKNGRPVKKVAPKMDPTSINEGFFG